jgi:hypothetical protein
MQQVIGFFIIGYCFFLSIPFDSLANSQGDICQMGEGS